MISAITRADTSGADPNDRVGPVQSGHLFHVIQMLEIVETEPHVAFCAFPSAFTEVMADDHMQLARAVEIEAQGADG
jgi:hypothetical protein